LAKNREAANFYASHPFRSTESIAISLNLSIELAASHDKVTFLILFPGEIIATVGNIGRFRWHPSLP